MEFARSRGRWTTAMIVVAVVALCLVSVTQRGPEASAATGEVTIGVIGDYGANNSRADAAAALVRGWSPDHIVTTGDNMYGTPSSVTGTDKFDLTVGRLFCGYMRGSAPGSRCPSGGTSPVNRFFPATGNHDYSDSGTNSGAVYEQYFNLPGAGATSTHPTGSDLYYDVVLGPVHVFVIDSEGALRSSAFMQQQRSWLQQAVAASTAPWQVVAMHDPPYSSGPYGNATQFQWPYASWGVDMVLAGHAHVYERVQRDGIPYLTVGLGGASRYDFGTPVQGSVVRFNSDEGAVRLHASDTTLRLQMITVGGVTVDDHTVTRTAPPTSTTTSPASTTSTTTTAPPGATTRVGVIGDYGWNHPITSQLANLVRAWSPDYVVTAEAT